MLRIEITEQQARAVARAARIALKDQANQRRMGPGDAAAAFDGINRLEAAVIAAYGEIARDE